MTLAGSVAGFATLGFTVRAYALGIQKRPIFEGELLMSILPLKIFQILTVIDQTYLIK